MVVDASVMIAWMINEPDFTLSDDIYHLLASNTINVPAHWPVEIANALNVNMRRGRIPTDELEALDQRLRLLNITIGSSPTVEDIMGMTKFASEHRLTVYDAAYVMLAQDLELALVTLDAEMREVAQRLRIPLLPA
jgi:predicted nucleic acid-binding protein